MAAARGRRLRAATGALAALTLGLLAPAATAHAGPTPARAVEDRTTITLTSVTPVVDATGGPATATIRGTVTNDGPTPLRRPTVTVAVGQTEMTRQGIADWAEGTDPATGTALDEDVAASSLAPGRSASFTLSIASADLLPGRSWGVAPLSVQTSGSAVHTFVGIHRAKEYEPLRLLWGVPVTLPPANQLWAAPGERRSRAWAAAAGEDSALARSTADAPGPGEMWLVDPTLLTAPDSDRGLPRAEREVRTERADALRDTLDPARTVVLPEADADIAAAAASDRARSLVRPRVDGGQRVATDLGARGDIAWPADGVVAGDRSAALQDLYGEQPTVIVPRTALTDTAITPHAFQTSRGGTPLLVTDPELSELAGTVGTKGGPSEILATQRLVADSAAILGDLPGTSRSIAIMPDRTDRPDPADYAALRDAVRRIPWTEPGELSDGDAESTSEPVDIPDTAAGEQAQPPLTDARARRIAADQRLRRSVASVRRDGRTWGPTVEEAQQQLTSARWRGSEWHLERLLSRVHRDVTATQRGLRVESGDLNFFADTGRLQVTVENHTDVELRNLEVRLQPGSPILRIDGSPEPITVGPGSRRTVTVQATALAPGRVPIDIEVTDPQGQALSTPAELRVRVSPTGSWIYWGIGAAAFGLLALGTWRTVRRRPTT